MAQVHVTINGRPYRMACEDGQEGHLLALAADLEGRLGQLRGAFGEIGDQRLMVMVAIMVADELNEARNRLRTLDKEVAALREARATARPDVGERMAADMLIAAAQRVERLTQSIAALSPREPQGHG